MAKGSSYFALGDKSVSENNHLMAYSVDLLSRRDYSIYIKDLRTGEILEDKIENTTGRITWANDNKTFFYTKKDEVTLRSYQIYRHIIKAQIHLKMYLFIKKRMRLLVVLFIRQNQENF